MSTARDLVSHAAAVRRYYGRVGTRLGYRLLLGDTRHFGWFDGRPHRFAWRFEPAMTRMECEIGTRLGLPAGSRVLDAGCGVGNVARSLAVRFRLNVTGVDITSADLIEAQRRSRAAGLGGTTQFLLGDYHRLPLGDASVDGVYTMETFVHAHDPERVLGEFRRVLRPGGRLVMAEYSRTPDERLTPAARVALRAVCEYAALPAWYRLHHGDLDRLLVHAGFELARPAEDVTARIRPMLRTLAALGQVPYLVARMAGCPERTVNAMAAVEMWRHQTIGRFGIHVAREPG